MSPLFALFLRQLSGLLESEDFDIREGWLLLLLLCRVVYILAHLEHFYVTADTLLEFLDKVIYFLSKWVS